MLRFTQMQVGSSKVEPQTLQRELFSQTRPRSAPRPSPCPLRPRRAARRAHLCPGLPLCPPPRSPAPPLDVVPVVARYFPLSAHGSVSAAPRSRLPNPDPATARPHSPLESSVSTRCPDLAAEAEAGSALGHHGLTSPGPLRSLHLTKQPPPLPGLQEALEEDGGGMEGGDGGGGGWRVGVGGIVVGVLEDRKGWEPRGLATRSPALSSLSQSCAALGK